MNKHEERTLAVIDGKTFRLAESEEEFAILDRMEDNAIIKEMSGEIVDSYFYRFSSRGDNVVELNARGIFEIARMYGGISCKTRLESDADNPDFIVTATAYEKIRDIEFEGGVQQAKRLPNGQEDKSAYAKAVTKAQRNALKKVLPYSLMRRLLLNFLTEQKEQELVAIRETALQRIHEYGYDVEIFNKFCEEKFGKPFPELDLENAKRAAAYIVTTKAKKQLRGGE
jgi:hypothetical protein